MSNLINGKDLIRTRWVSEIRRILRNTQKINLNLCQSILLFVAVNLFLPLLLSHLSTAVNYRIVLTLNIWALLLHIILKDLVDIDVQANELS